MKKLSFLYFCVKTAFGSIPKTQLLFRVKGSSNNVHHFSFHAVRDLEPCSQAREDELLLPVLSQANVIYETKTRLVKSALLQRLLTNTQPLYLNFMTLPSCAAALIITMPYTWKCDCLRDATFSIMS